MGRSRTASKQPCFYFEGAGCPAHPLVRQGITDWQEERTIGYSINADNLLQLSLPGRELGLAAHETAHLHELPVVVVFIEDEFVVGHAAVLGASGFVLGLGLSYSHF